MVENYLGASQQIGHGISHPTPRYLGTHVDLLICPIAIITLILSSAELVALACIGFIGSWPNVSSHSLQDICLA